MIFYENKKRKFWKSVWHSSCYYYAIGTILSVTLIKMLKGYFIYQRTPDLFKYEIRNTVRGNDINLASIKFNKYPDIKEKKHFILGQK